MNLKEIAKALNVSPATVSLVLNNKAGVGPETRARVQKLLQENGYNGKQYTVHRGNIQFLKYAKHAKLVDGNEGFIASIIDSAGKAARSQMYNMLLTPIEGSHFEEAFRALSANPPAGVLVLGTELDRSYYSLLTTLNIPIVVVDNLVPNHPVDCVVMNNQEIVYMALEYLKKMGHTQIGYLRSQVQIENFSERCLGYRASLEKLSLPYAPEFVYTVDATMKGSFESMCNILAEKPPLPTALFADNDTIAIGCMKALKEFGYRIPEDISIIGFDDIPFCSISDPPLTTMQVPTSEIGNAAVQLLCHRIEQPTAPISKIQYGATLIERSSVRRN